MFVPEEILKNVYKRIVSNEKKIVKFSTLEEVNNFCDILIQ